ncbi:MAG: competence/damage-inducible protein A [Candidatus Thorarchaeota archaeon]|nr:competence/damage-inducible protein A [Candidatus Thorarchaeota archaeon]
MSNKSLRAGILTIGNEILNGLVLDTNANWMEKQLVKLGVEMRRLASVRDEIDEIGTGLGFLAKHCDVVITSGGLGPTHDDMTLQAIAVAFGVKLEQNVDAVKIVERQYKILHEKGIVASPDMSESRLKMARIPEESKPLNNAVGGAPGVMLEYQGTTIFCLPGVPAELKNIWDTSVRPWLSEKVVGSYYEEIVEFTFVDESVFAPHIENAMNEHPGVWVKSMPKRYGTTKIMTVWISSRGSELDEEIKRVKDAIKTLEGSSRLSAKPVEK